MPDHGTTRLLHSSKMGLSGPHKAGLYVQSARRTFSHTILLKNYANCLLNPDERYTNRTYLALSVASLFFVSMAALCSRIFFIISSFESACGSLKDGAAFLICLFLIFPILLLSVPTLLVCFVGVAFFFAGFLVEESVSPLGFLLDFLNAPTFVP